MVESLEISYHKVMVERLEGSSQRVRWRNIPTHRERRTEKESLGDVEWKGEKKKQERTGY